MSTRHQKLKTFKFINFSALSLVATMLMGCNSASHKELSNVKFFVGDYVTPEYFERNKGYDWTTVGISAISNDKAKVIIRSRADIKKPTCTFDGVGQLNPKENTLVINDSLGQITITKSLGKITITSDSPQALYYYCSGGASLYDTYQKLLEPVDKKQLSITK